MTDGGGIRIAPSVLSADLSWLADQVKQVLAGGADWVHVDVMDGRFVPNLTFGANMIAALRGLTDQPIDVHLMVVEPERYLESFAAAGASIFTFHPEATVHVQRLLAAVRGQGGLFAVQDFSQSVPDLSVEQQEQKVVSLLAAQGFRPANATAGARKTCETDAGFGGTSARAMIRFETTDLEKLPEVLKRKIRSEPYSKAAVGACRTNGASGFARYRLVVLFF